MEMLLGSPVVEQEVRIACVSPPDRACYLNAFQEYVCECCDCNSC